MGSPAVAKSSHADVRLGWRERLSYASGSVASNLSWNMVAGFLVVYYTDVALIPAALVGTLVLATRVFDAVFDPIVGVLVDRTRSRWGKTRPYLLFAPIPFAVVCVFVFSVPTGWSLGARLVYAYASFGLLGFLYSFLYVPYGALQPLLSSNKNELLTVSGLRSMGTSVASVFVYSLAAPAILYFGGGAGGYRGAAAFFAVITTALYLVTFLNCRERVQGSPATDRSKISQAVPRMFRNPIWLIVMTFEVLIFIRLGFFASVMAFYARLVIGSAAAVSVLLPVLSAGIFTGGLVGPSLLRRFGKRRGTIYVLLFTILVFATVPFVAHGLIPFAIVLYFGAFGNGVQAVMAYTLIAESVELQEERFSARDAGLLTSVAAFNQKIGFAIGSAITAWALAYSGYKPDVNVAAVPTTLTALMCGLPIAVALAQLLIISQYRYDGYTFGASRYKEQTRS